MKALWITLLLLLGPLPPVQAANPLLANPLLQSEESEILPVAPVAMTVTAPAAGQSSGAAQSEQDRLAGMLAGSSLALTLAAFFGAGLLIAFTPCVFPMYPILTGIIAGAGSKLSTGRAFSLSFLYVQGMAITYTALGLVVASAGAQVQAAFQHPAILVALSLLFVVLAAAMFGLFNLQLPSGLQERLNAISNKQKGGSMAGVLVMGVISGLVASPCTTAPLTGALLYVAQSGDMVLGGLALYALSMGMGLPLLLLGTSGGKLLPRAGAWMETIKHLFGFMLLAVPVLLLGRLLPEWSENLLWAALLLVAFSYLAQANSTSRGGFWKGARTLAIFLGLFSGAVLGYRTLFPPAAVQQAEQHGQFQKVRNLAEMQQVIAAASAQGKPVMVDFYADWCVACKEFEKYTFTDPRVQARFKDMVLVQTDVTDNTEQDIEMMNHYQVLGLPTLLFFDGQGQELKTLRVTGFQKADRFLETLARL
ncbi:protein-disulfide reductase DsbD [Gallaecimonas sp. GXIMD4217]|uniref:protein-disulfide reductase DsbD n=1 Tax=Gallaecimonas sp. GXIMD4217 TaxID=3131927 RepID=UPI00311AC5F3